MVHCTYIEREHCKYLLYMLLLLCNVICAHVLFQFVKEDVDRFRIDSAHIPVCEVRIMAGSKAEPFFAKDVEVTGCVEELSFRVSRLLIQKKGQ